MGVGPVSETVRYSIRCFSLDRRILIVSGDDRIDAAHDIVYFEAGTQ